MRGCSTNEVKKGEIGKMFLRRRFDVCALVTILKKQATSNWRWRIDVDAGLVFILNIDTRSQFQEKRKVIRGEKGS